MMLGFKPKRARSPGEPAALQEPLKQELRSGPAAQQTNVARRTDAEVLALLKSFNEQLAAPYVDRVEEARAITLALISKEHVIMVSQPGTAKSHMAKRAGDLLNAKFFKTQLNKYTDPAQIFGPIDVKAFQEGQYTTKTKEKLPEAEIAFIDEPFRGGSAIRDTLFSIMNEREMFDGEKTIPVPLRTIISATNFVSYDTEDQAFYDRFLLRHFIDPVKGNRVSNLVDAAWNMEFKGTGRVSKPIMSVADLDQAYELISKVDTSGIKEQFLEVLSRAETLIKQSGENDEAFITDRRKGKALKLVAANALLEGRKHATMEDLIVLKYVLPADEREAKLITALLNDVISPTNHINRMHSLQLNINRSIEDLATHPNTISNFGDAQRAMAIAMAYARKTSRTYSNKELRKAASELTAAAKRLSDMTSKARALEQEQKPKTELMVLERNGVSN